VASRHEGGPYTLVEALHMRVPVISTKVGFAPEFLPASALIKEPTVPALAAALAAALTDLAGLRARLAPAFDLAAREATLAAMTRKVLAVYQQVLNNRQG
jgi:glycosyltransferase involved in cell wall biosynthesis